MRKLAAIAAIALSAYGTSAIGAEDATVGRGFSGNISWYGEQFHGKKTASGQPFDMYKLTCAHRTLPFGTLILITNPRNGKTVIVEVTDRGPFAQGRIVDVSREAARRLGTILGGIAYMNCLVVDKSIKQISPAASKPEDKQ